MVVSETMLFHVLPLQNHKSLQNPLQNGLLLLLTWHSSKGLAPDCAGSIFASIHTFFCSSIMRPQSERSSSHVPHHSISCPYKLTGFLPSTYKRGWRCCCCFFSLFYRTYNSRLWTVQNCSRFWHPSCGSFKTNRHTQTEQHNHLLVCFLIVLSFERKKDAANPSVVLLPSIWVLGAFWVYYKWASWNWLRKAVLEVSNCSAPLRANVLSTQWVLDNARKQPSKTILIKKYNAIGSLL